MYRVRTRSGTGHVPGRVLPRTGCVHGRVRDTDGPCAWPVYDRVHSLYTAEGGRAQSVHGRPRPCTDCVHGRARAMYMVRPSPCTRPCRRPCLRPVCTAVHVPCIWPCTRPFMACTDRVHRRATAVYIVRPRPCTGYTYTVVYSVHGRVYGPCTRPPTAVYRLCTRPCTGHVHGPSVTRSRPCTRPVHGRVP